MSSLEPVDGSASSLGGSGLAVATGGSLYAVAAVGSGVGAARLAPRAGPASSSRVETPAAAMTIATATANSRLRSPSCSGRLNSWRSSSITVPVVRHGVALALAEIAGAAHDVLVQRARRDRIRSGRAVRGRGRRQAIGLG